MEKQLTKEKKEQIQNKIMELLACILYSPNVIPWIELDRVARYLCGMNKLGPKWKNQVACCIYQIYNKLLVHYKKNPHILFRISEPLSLGEILDNNGVFYCNEIYNQISNCRNNHAVNNYLKTNASRSLNRAKNIIMAEDIVILKKTFGYASPIESLFTLLKWKMEKFEENKDEIYLLTKELDKEITKNQWELIELEKVPMKSCKPPKLNIENWNEKEQINIEGQEEWVKKAEELIKKLKRKYIVTADENTQFKIVEYIKDLKSILIQSNYYDLRVAVNEVTEYLR